MRLILFVSAFTVFCLYEVGNAAVATETNGLPSSESYRNLVRRSFSFEAAAGSALLQRLSALATRMIQQPNSDVRLLNFNYESIHERRFSNRIALSSRYLVVGQLEGEATAVEAASQEIKREVNLYGLCESLMIK